MNVDVSGLADAIMSELQAYSEETEEKVANGIDRISEQLVSELKNDPVIPVKSGKYKKGFYFKKVAQGRGFKRNTVANKRYQLTHLLEYGHATRGGTGRTRAFPHWENAEKRADELMEGMTKDL